MFYLALYILIVALASVSVFIGDWFMMFGSFVLALILSIYTAVRVILSKRKGRDE